MMSQVAKSNSVFSAFHSPGDEIPRDYERENRGIKPEFFLEKVDVKLEADGVERPQYLECVRLRIAGDSLNSPCLPVDDEIRKRYASAYAAFKDDTKQAEKSATLLRDWEALPEGLADELERFNIETVDELSGLSDSNLDIIQNCRFYRDQAITFVAGRSESKRFRELASANAALQTQLDEIKAQLAGVIGKGKATRK